jgi:arginyl-tRNA synthetase
VKTQLATLIKTALSDLALEIPGAGIRIDRTKDASHGDFASNIALMLAKSAGKPPRDVAQMICDALPIGGAIEKVEIAGPGFINFFVSSDASTAIVGQVLEAGSQFGQSNLGKGEKVMVEFVSANPTGPLHVGHGRGLAFGASLANILKATGHVVHKEYYVNDAGRQMQILTASVWVRYLQTAGEEIAFPSNAYKGDYIGDYGRELFETHGDAFRHPAASVLDSLPEDFNPETDTGDKDAYIDALIERAQTLLGSTDYNIVFEKALNAILDDIKDDVEEYGAGFDEWFSERSLNDDNALDIAVQTLRDNGHIYEQDGAQWFRSSELGDDKDRVVIRDNGLGTYFASDIAYHQNKCRRGFGRLIDVWGSDHHGYIARVKAAMEALGEDKNKLDVRLVQFAVLWRGKEKVGMSTRSGQFVTLRQLRAEVGNDACRFFYVMRSADQHLDFDLELATSKSNENPVYYIQYAHARIHAVMNKLTEREFVFDQANGLNNLALLDTEHEQALMKRIASYPELLDSSARNCAPHSMAHYLRDLSADFHSWYNACAFVVEDDNLRDARISLALATRQTIANGLGLLGVSAPEKM